MKNLSRLTALLLALVLIFSSSVGSIAESNLSDLTRSGYDQMVLAAQEAAEAEAAAAAKEAASQPIINEGGVVYEQDIPEQTKRFDIYEVISDAQLTMGGETEITLPQSGKINLSAGTAAQWQIYIPGADMWVNIAGETGDTFALTYAVIGGMLSGGSAKVRALAGDSAAVANISVAYGSALPPVEEEDTFVAETATASTFSLRSSDANAGIMLAAEEPTLGTYNIVVNYVFENSEVVAEPYTANLAAGSNFSATVTFPEVQGYLPYLGNDTESTTSLELNITDIQADVTYTVTYKPTNVDYTVIHYWQNVDNDNYTEHERETLQGLTKSIVPEVKNEYPGFYALLYEKPTIAADGSTVVEIYYDRSYYLMTFDLDGGYGVEPIYARYGAEIDIDEPKKSGYTFDTWSATIPDKMPAENSSYIAYWTAADSSFTVVYWLENADDDGYSVFGSHVVAAQTGDVVNGETYKTYDNYIETDDNFADVEPFIEYEKADAGVTVKGDKSTVVNVYYSRESFTLKFYYAMEDTTNSKYYVVGGSSYAFGASGDNTTNSISNITKYYMDGGSWVGNRGEVDEIPSLNGNGASRSYSTGYDTDSKDVTTGNWWNQTTTTYNYKYYYIAFDAKYGADISELWPCNVFNSVTRLNKDTTNDWSGTEAFVSAWNGEHHVYYSQHNDNQTIKGNYNQLDTQLLWDYAKFAAYADDNNVVDYLCFWENGANIGWSVPELYRYKVWVPVLDGQDITEKETTTYNGVTYYLRNTYDTCDDSTVDQQTAPSIQGLTNVDYDWSLITEFDTTLYKEAYNVNFYYSRNQYTLSFQNDGETEAEELIYFEADISDLYFEPSYPSTLEENAYEFEGWYTSSTCAAGTQFSFEGNTMPANNIMLYANWVLKQYEVRFWENEAAIWMDDYTDEELDNMTEEEAALLADPIEIYPETVHGKTIPAAYGDQYWEPDYTITESYENHLTFIGWFYRNENGVEKAFDLNSSLVKSEMDIYAKWSSNIFKPYKIYYKIQGTDTLIAETETGNALAGTTKTFEAKGGTDLVAGYQEGYFPIVKSHSLTIDASGDESGIQDQDVNVFTFWYVQKDAVPYTVKYLDAVTGEPLLAEKVVSDNRKAVVTETFEPISGYMPDAYQKRLVVDGTDGAVNEIIFYYTEDTKHAYYKITHFTENLDGETWTEYTSSQAVGDIGTRYTGSPLTIPGFTYKEIKYFVDEVEVTTDITAEGVPLTNAGLEINLYYVRNEYPYQVRYLEQGTGKELHVPKDGKGLYGQVISESAIDIANYTAVAPTSQTLTIKIEESQTEAKLNIITFYYTENTVPINYIPVGPDNQELKGDELTAIGSVSPTTENVKIITGVASGSTATLHGGPTYKFVGWYSDAACTNLVSTDASYVPQQPGRSLDTTTGVITNGLWPETTTYYAKFDWDVGKLTITKSGMENDESAIFAVKVKTASGEAKTWNVVLNAANPSVTLANLEANAAYEVTEVGDWSKLYDVTKSTGLTGTIPGGGVATATIENQRTDKWLNDESSAKNVFNAVSVTE